MTKMKTFLKLATIAFCAAAILPVPAPSIAAKKPAATTTASDDSAAGPAKFYGTITAVDAAAKTFTIDKQTFTVAADSHLTKAADDAAATIADAVVGETARGTFTKAADGTLKVTKARFGKKAGGGKKNKESSTKPAAAADSKPAGASE